VSVDDDVHFKSSLPSSDRLDKLRHFVTINTTLPTTAPKPTSIFTRPRQGTTSKSSIFVKKVNPSVHPLSPTVASPVSEIIVSPLSAKPTKIMMMDMSAASQIDSQVEQVRTQQQKGIHRYFTKER
jgi:hypothetical protein